MRSGDLSNRCAPCIAFRVEDFLIRFKETKIPKKVLNLIRYTPKFEVDKKVISALDFIFKHTDMTSVLIMDHDNFGKRSIIEALERLPISRIIPILKPVEVAILLNTGSIDYYVDDDSRRISIIGHKYCISLAELNTLMRGR